MSLTQELEKQIQETKARIDEAIEPVTRLKPLMASLEGQSETLEQGVKSIGSLTEVVNVSLDKFKEATESFSALVKQLESSQPEKTYECAIETKESIGTLNKTLDNKFMETTESFSNILKKLESPLPEKTYECVTETKSSISEMNNAFDEKLLALQKNLVDFTSFHDALKKGLEDIHKTQETLLTKHERTEDLLKSGLKAISEAFATGNNKREENFNELSVKLDSVNSAKTLIIAINILYSVAIAGAFFYYLKM